MGINTISENQIKLKKRNYVLAISIDEYGEGANLANCVNDANGLIEVLIKQYGFEEDHIFRLFNEKATRRGIDKELSRLRDILDQECNLILFFSGHGENDGDIHFIVPSDGVLGEHGTFYSICDLTQRLNGINCFHMLVILNSCFAGGLFESTTRQYSDPTGNLPSRWGISAGHSKEKVFDGTPGENSPFSKALIECLKENDEQIGVIKLGEIVRRKVFTQAKQTVITKNLKIDGDKNGQFIFCPVLKHAVSIFIDPRDNKRYKTIKVNDITWMAQNLAFKLSKECWSYENDPNKVEDCGYLYSWDSAIAACPEGWQLPSEAEWNDLLAYFGGENEGFKKLSPGGMSNFDADLFGWRTPGGSFSGWGTLVQFWSIDEIDSKSVKWVGLSASSNKVINHFSTKDWGLYVRCIKRD
jgi:uncharacterized protein (TIGR02145 family)